MSIHLCEPDHFREVKRVTVCKLRDLLTTAEAIGEEERSRLCVAYCGQQRMLSHRNGNTVLLTLEAERSWSAANSTSIMGSVELDPAVRDLIA